MIGRKETANESEEVSAKSLSCKQTHFADREWGLDVLMNVGFKSRKVKGTATFGKNEKSAVIIVRGARGILQ